MIRVALALIVMSTVVLCILSIFRAHPLLSVSLAVILGAAAYVLVLLPFKEIDFLAIRTEALECIRPHVHNTINDQLS